MVAREPSWNGMMIRSTELEYQLINGQVTALTVSVTFKKFVMPNGKVVD